MKIIAYAKVVEPFKYNYEKQCFNFTNLVIVEKESIIKENNRYGRLPNYNKYDFSDNRVKINIRRK